MAYLYVPNGVIMDKWRPEGTGLDLQFNESMKSLNDFKNDLQVIKGLEQANGWAGLDGAGDHARGGATFLTGARPRKTAGSDIRLGVSVDQMACKLHWFRNPAPLSRAILRRGAQVRQL
jgi:hypothetical protein